jgi:hypothetical protein
MTARPPRASTKGGDGKGDGRRGKPRSLTQTERDKPDKRRTSSAVPIDRYERIDDDEILDVSELPDTGIPGPRLRMLVLEAVPHLAAAQGAIVEAGHAVVIGSAGRDGIDKLRFAVSDVDAMLVGMPGGEPLIETALAMGPWRPVIITAWTGTGVEAARHSAAVGADLSTVRPHDVERLAPILLAASRLFERRQLFDLSRSGIQVAPGFDPDLDVDSTVGPPLDPDPDPEPALEPDPEPTSFLQAEPFAQAVLRQLDRARRYGYPIAVAMFVVDVPEPPPPPGLRGILRARAGNALVHALRDVDLATELDQDRFLVVMPHTDRAAGAELARRIIGAVAAGDPVTSGGRVFPPRVIGAVTSAPPGQAPELPGLVRDATQLLEQARVSGASLAVAT